MQPPVAHPHAATHAASKPAAPRRSRPAAARAALEQVTRSASLLRAALGDDPAFYERLVHRGFLDNAIDFARYAAERIDDVVLRDAVQETVVDPLVAARRLGPSTASHARLTDHLAAAATAAAAALGPVAAAR
ncbi:MAG: hypothetical protein JWM98_2825 [Thermoleophilia bacterium]|nr:hypothetical protein [Thermoleophilia bacterium]